MTSQLSLQKIPSVDADVVDLITGHPKRASAISIFPSRVSLNTHFGCSLGCSYCCLPYDRVSTEPFRAKRTASIEELFEGFDQLCRDSRYTNLKLSVGDHSDPFLSPEIAADTLRILQGLAARGITNPVMLTSKLRPPKHILERIGALKQLKLSVFISIADTRRSEGRVDPDNIESRLLALKDFKRHGVHTVFFLKPIGPWTDPKKISKMVQENRDSIDEVVLSPLMVDPESRYPDIGVEGPPIGLFGDDWEDLIIREIHSVAPELPISRKRSCAINRHWGLSCMPPRFETQNRTNNGELFLSSMRDHGGYCRIYPKRSFQNIDPRVMSVLSKLGNLFRKHGVTWALIGSLQRTLSNPKASAVDCNDIDIAVSKKGLARIINELKNIDPRAAEWVGCKGDCSNRELQPGKADWQIVAIKRLRLLVRLQIDGIQVDVTSKSSEVVNNTRTILVAGMELPLAEASSPSASVNDRRHKHQVKA